MRPAAGAARWVLWAVWTLQAVQTERGGCAFPFQHTGFCSSTSGLCYGRSIARRKGVTCRGLRSTCLRFQYPRPSSSWRHWRGCRRRCTSLPGGESNTSWCSSPSRFSCSRCNKDLRRHPRRLACNAAWLGTRRFHARPSTLSVRMKIHVMSNCHHASP
jgi:hypothetical protein